MSPRALTVLAIALLAIAASPMAASGQEKMDPHTRRKLRREASDLLQTR